MKELTLPPDEALDELVPVDVPVDPTDLRHPAELDVWYGHVWSRLGRGDLAWEWWDQVEVEVLGPWVAAERARVLRELGLHAAASWYDELGLSTVHDPVEMVMLRLGLAADALGLGDAEGAAIRFGAADALLRTLPDGPRTARQRLRRSWVAVELSAFSAAELDLDTLPDLDEDGEPSFPDDYDSGTRFHRAKGLLFAAIARRDADLLDAAAAAAPPMLLWAVELARADRGDEGADDRAREAWDAIVPPPGYEEDVQRTPTAKRIREAGSDRGKPPPARMI